MSESINQEQQEVVKVNGGELEVTPAEKEYLDKAFPVAEDQKNSAPVRAEDGKFVKQSEQQDAEQAKPKGYDKAVKALKLDGWTDEDVSALDSERVIALGKKAKERHSEIGKKLQSRSAEPESDEESEEGSDEESDDSESPSLNRVQSEDGADDQEDQGDDEAEEEELGSAEPTSQPFTREKLRSMVSPLSDAIGLGDEVGDELAKVLEQAVAPLQGELLRYRQYHEQIIRERGEELGAKAREKLADQFPGLKDEEKFERVVQKMGTLAKANNYDSMESLMFDAAKLELFDEAKDNASKTAISSKRSLGQPVTSNRSMPNKAMSVEDREDKALDALLQGKGRDAAKRAYYGQ